MINIKILKDGDSLSLVKFSELTLVQDHVEKIIERFKENPQDQANRILGFLGERGLYPSTIPALQKYVILANNLMRNDRSVTQVSEDDKDTVFKKLIDYLNAELIEKETCLNNFFELGEKMNFIQFLQILFLNI